MDISEKAKKYDEIIAILKEDNGKTTLQFNSIIAIMDHKTQQEPTTEREKEIFKKYNASQKVIEAMKQQRDLADKVFSKFYNN